MSLFQQIRNLLGANSTSPSPASAAEPEAPPQEDELQQVMKDVQDLIATLRTGIEEMDAEKRLEERKAAAMEDSARRAVIDGREDDARRALEKKAQYDVHVAELVRILVEHRAKLNRLHEQLRTLAEEQTRRDREARRRKIPSKTSETEDRLHQFLTKLELEGKGKPPPRPADRVQRQLDALQQAHAPPPPKDVWFEEEAPPPPPEKTVDPWFEPEPPKTPAPAASPWFEEEPPAPPEPPPPEKAPIPWFDGPAPEKAPDPWFDEDK